MCRQRCLVGQNLALCLVSAHLTISRILKSHQSRLMFPPGYVTPTTPPPGYVQDMDLYKCSAHRSDEWKDQFPRDLEEGESQGTTKHIS